MPRVRVMVAFSDETVEHIDEILEHYDFRSRSHFIDAAVRGYLDELEEELEEDRRAGLI